MSVLGLGVDIASIARFRALRNPKRVAAFYLSPDEYGEAEAAPDRATWLASRFAAKEAVIKATEHPLSPLSFRIVKDGVRPIVSFADNRTDRYLISLSHERDYACATALRLPS